MKKPKLLQGSDGKPRILPRQPGCQGLKNRPGCLARGGSAFFVYEHLWREFMTKYGANALNHKVLCTRCADAVPVYLRRILDRSETRVEIHCLKCKYHGHKGGTYIGELKRGS